MSQRITVTVTCDEKVSPDCAGSYEESAPQLGQLDGITMRIYQQGWDRGYQRPGVDGQPFYDVCGPCQAVLDERQREEAGRTGEAP